MGPVIFCCLWAIWTVVVVVHRIDGANARLADLAVGFLLTMITALTVAFLTGMITVSVLVVRDWCT